MANWPGWKAYTQHPSSGTNRSPSLVGTCSLLTTVSVLSLPRLLLIHMPDPYHFVAKQVWQPFRLVYLPTSSFVAVKHRQEWEDWLLGLTRPDANHVVLRTLCSLLGTQCSHLQQEENVSRIICSDVGYTQSPNMIFWNSVSSGKCTPSKLSVTLLRFNFFSLNWVWKSHKMKGTAQMQWWL